ncbi:MAG: tRNA (guanosine(37)-N1)-methyltransferase TrmD [Phycisphaerae bacterium]|nr:tRNA (guanosine(37)-N1)-methyltransferase TrmD [Phycisphaerae bacterium]
MRIDVLTLFPQQVDDFLNYSIIGRARQRGLVEIVCTDIRTYSGDKHGKVDDKPFGGGPGMVLRPQPVVEAVEAVEAADQRRGPRILMTPQGRRLDQPLVRDLAAHDRLIVVAGHYEGFDERVRLILAPTEISIGDYVLSGGEPAAVVLIDAVVRLLEGVVGDEESLAEESFTHSRLEYPQYTRPREYRGHQVPEVLISGHHAEIEKWRTDQAQKRTADRRPDLIQ